MIRKVSILVVCVLALGTVACGQQSKDEAVNVDTGLDAHALAASADQTAAASTAKVHMSVTMDGSSKARPPPGVRRGRVYDTASGLSAMTMDLGSLVGGKIEIVQHGDVSYMRMGARQGRPVAVGQVAEDGRAPRRRRWAARRRACLTGTDGVGDPSAILEYSRAGADITTVGHEDVGGVDTTHVHATISVQQALDAPSRPPRWSSPCRR